MNEPYLLLLAFLLGIASGFIGGIASGGGLISIPGLMFLGLPPSTAIATNNLNIVSSLTSALRYHKHAAVNLRLIRSLAWLDILGSLVGAALLLSINVTVMQKLFGVVCILLATLINANKHLKNAKTSHKLLAPALVFLASVFAGMFGTGGGLLLIYILSYFYRLPLREANANSKLISFGGAFAIILLFAHAGKINFAVGIPLMLGSALGGYIGAHTALKKEEKVVRKLLVVIAVSAGLKLLI